MSLFVNNVLESINKNDKLNKEPLILMILESTNKSLSLNEKSDKVYSSLRSGLAAINERIKNPELTKILVDFNNNDNTPEVRLAKLANEVNIKSKLNSIKESNIYVNPIIKSKIEEFENTINNGQPEFTLCDPFIKTFEAFAYDPTIRGTLDGIGAYIAKNKSKLAVLNAIGTVYSMQSPVYHGIGEYLKESVLSGEYSSDIIKMKYGTTVPFVSQLISELSLIESVESGNFTLGLGNTDTVVSNHIAPAIKIEEGILIFTDNRFISIREAKGLDGNEKKVLIDDTFKISEVNPEYVLNKYSNFYHTCEAISNLGFKKLEDGSGLESQNVRNFKVGFKINEKKEIDLYINDSKIGNIKDAVADMSEALVLESTTVKQKINLILENSEVITNFEFIKDVVNNRRLSEASIFKLNSEYYICEKLNSADRTWTKVNEFELYEFFNTKFNYDISKIFKTEISKEVEKLKKIEESKLKISEDIGKLESSVNKLIEACNDPKIDISAKNKLMTLKESIEESVKILKNEYIKCDLLKKKEIV